MQSELASLRFDLQLFAEKDSDELEFDTSDEEREEETPQSDEPEGDEKPPGGEDDKVTISKADWEASQRKIKSLEPIVEKLADDPLLIHKIIEGTKTPPRREEAPRREVRESNPEEDNQRFFTDPAGATREYVGRQTNDVLAYFNLNNNQTALKEFKRIAKEQDPNLWDMIKNEWALEEQNATAEVLSRVPPAVFQQNLATTYDTVCGRVLRPAYQKGRSKGQSKENPRLRSVGGTHPGTRTSPSQKSNVDKLAEEIGAAWGLKPEDLAEEA